MRRLLIPRNVSRKKLLLASVICFYLFISEVLVYYIQSLRWPAIPSTGVKEDELKVLFVADAQLIGHSNEFKTVGPFGFVTRRDSDRYLHKTFNLAYSHVQPDVVIFMGDLLDEGSITTNDRYEEYVNRFYAIFQKARESKMIFLHGDNDVGGEGLDMKTDAKVERFEKYFGPIAGVVTEGSVDFVKINYDFPDRYADEKLMELKRITDETNKRHFKIVINHQSVFKRAPFQFKPVLDMVVPNLLFAAHEHTSHVIECWNCYLGGNNRGGWAKPEDVVTVDMKDLKMLREIVVPTCSYRMGVPDMGYGVAVINKSGLVKYTVLWLPHRYTVLYSYFFFVTVIILGSGAYYFFISRTSTQHRHWNQAKLKSTKFSV
ncbi:metallophosphoesterase 1 homolog [Lineus longissimus]|uniref:metallophosphoesterase 1 homolog n=1 Tax=Lineus longissimus TaxID=88925 RepID=UPI002B4E37A2